MGWNGGSQLFDIVARGVAEVSRSADITDATALVLIDLVARTADFLHTEDWDVCDEVVQDWQSHSLVLAGLTLSGCVDGHGRRGSDDE